MKSVPSFSKDTLKFILKAARQKNPDWLDKNRAEYEEVILRPLQHLAATLKSELGTQARGYHFPQKGIGRLRRSIPKGERNAPVYKDWLSYTASRPTDSMFDKNPSLFFMINPNDREGDEVLIAGGMYMPSSRQLKSIREAIAADATAFDRLFASKPFATRFPGGFSRERSATRPPRGFDPQHPRLEWLKLQGYYVWRSYRSKDYTGANFAKTVAADCAQILRLNELLEQALQGRWANTHSSKKPASQAPRGLMTQLDELELPRREMDF